ncbi:MAG: Glycine zipper 2TM domain protein [Syntrophorhabdaceae bacterium PtaU1.Bin034]|nr:MAG: Glycine zipper 2TM domain protein [Syntrophorhabdaceae bacterium PtaU1.Bin034]
MNKALLGLLVLAAFLTYSCATGEGYNTQKGAAIGAIGGALAGQAIGRNTAGTLIGAAVGALTGAVAGNAVDQHQTNRRLEQQQATGAAGYASPAPTPADAPPGRWVEVPGQWVGGKWVPAHKAWVPINP